MHLFPYKWYLKDGYPSKNIQANNYNVFGTFICGGGSTMGYKLAGFNHLGGVEIDPKIAKVYQLNHKPKHLFLEDIRHFVKRSDIPKELYNLDLLDGSPPCSSFSMAGNREKDWGKKKVFKEGQAEQVLDDLFFEYIALAKKLQPKIVLAENVKGLIQGNAKLYVKKIFKAFNEAGYNVQLFLLNAASMGVPQKRERVFFICQRKDLNLPKLKLEFSEDAIPFKEATFEFWNISENELGTNCLGREYPNIKQGESSKKYFQLVKIKENEVCPTITTGISQGSTASIVHPIQPRKFNKFEACIVGTYPIDYDFQNVKAGYLIGMSVPPVMTAQIANQIKIQWLDKITDKKQTYGIPS
jgi:DNA (cytosine-5)-methyltransferase 1